MYEYSTRQIFYDTQPDLLEKIGFDCDIKLSYRKDPSNLHWVGNRGVSFTNCNYFPDTEKLEKLKSTDENAFELIILSSDEMLAKNINSLIYSGRLLCYPEIRYTEHDLLDAGETGKLIETGGNLVEFFKQEEISVNLILACLIASFASNRKLEYALEKYKYSLQHDHITPHSADPYHGKIFYTDIRENSSNVNTIYAFFSAYTIIEELNLDIKSSEKNPRFIKGSNEWNPVVLEDIIKRLQKNGVDPNDTVEWLIRGTPGPLYDEIKPKFTKQSKWYNPDNDVFDLELKIYEAIHYCSYIRNYFLAHKTREIVKYINPYDIFNMQSLARRLILSSLGVWNFMNNYINLIK